MQKIQRVETVLNAFVGLFTQPFEQDLKASIRAAATSIFLAGLLPLQGLALVAQRGSLTALEVGRTSFVLVLVWMAATAVFSRAGSRQLAIARNLSVLSFWIAVTLVLVLTVELVFTKELVRASKLASVLGMLLLCVPVHMFRNLHIRSALPMTLALWLSTGALAWRIIS